MFAYQQENKKKTKKKRKSSAFNLKSFIQICVSWRIKKMNSAYGSHKLLLYKKVVGRVIYVLYNVICIRLYFIFVFYVILDKHFYATLIFFTSSLFLLFIVLLLLLPLSSCLQFFKIPFNPSPYHHPIKTIFYNKKLCAF